MRRCALPPWPRQGAGPGLYSDRRTKVRLEHPAPNHSYSYLNQARPGTNGNTSGINMHML